MLTLRAEQSESLWDVVLPVGVRELPEDLARIDVLLGCIARVFYPVDPTCDAAMVLEWIRSQKHF
jgi:hypothetical protein